MDSIDIPQVRQDLNLNRKHADQLLCYSNNHGKLFNNAGGIVTLLALAAFCSMILLTLNFMI